MKKTQKKTLGLLGLGLVVATTAFAVALPAPEASAVTDFKDEITVRVVGQVPNIDITKPESGKSFTSPVQTLAANFENVETLDAIISYKGADGVEHVASLFGGILDVDYCAGSLTASVDFMNGNYSYSYEYTDDDGVTHTVTGTDQLPFYGYGDYSVSINGDSSEGVSDSDAITFGYYPVVASATTDEESEKIKVDLDYDPYDPADEDSGDVTKVVVNVYDEDGNLVEGSPIEVNAPEKEITIGYGDRSTSGTYRIEVFAYGRDGELLYEKPYTFSVSYTIIPVPNTADTGSFFQSLNISKSDYLITGLMIFFIVAIFGFIFIARNNKKQSKLGSRRKH